MSDIDSNEMIRIYYTRRAKPISIADRHIICRDGSLDVALSATDAAVAVEKIGAI